MTATPRSDGAPIAAVSELHHVYLVCTDVERTVAFYREVLGLQVRTEVDLSGPQVDVIQGSSGCRGRAVWGRIPGCTTRFEFVEWTVPRTVLDNEHRDRRPGLQMLSFAVHDAAAAARGLRAARLPAEGPLDMPDDSRLVMTRDPDGTVIEFVQLPAR